MSFRHKIKSPEELVPILAQLKAKGKNIVLCHGVYDLYHRGHLHQFEQARVCGDILIVSLTTDRFVRKGPGRPIFDQMTRAEMLAALEVIDYVTFSDEESSVGIINLVRPDVYVKGQQYAETAKDLTGKIVQEQEAVEAIGGRVHFTVEMPIRSTPLLNSYIDPYPDHVLKFLAEFKKHFSIDQIVEYISILQSLRVLVVGEAIIDQYDFCEQMDVSPKGVVLALKHLYSEQFAGGSLACANHISNFCPNVRLVTALGPEDPYETFIQEHLSESVERQFVRLPYWKTILKKREIDPTYFRKQTETYYFDDRSISSEEEEIFIETLTRAIPGTDFVFVVDYGHGLITDRVVDFLTRSGAFLAVNTQTNSANRGYHVITRYPRLNYACIDHLEARLALRAKIDPIEKVARRLNRTLNTNATTVTLGHRGSLFMISGEEVLTPIFSKKIVDTIGAGDAFFSITAPLVAKGLPPPVVGFLGNIAGALATTYLGNRQSVTKKMVTDFMTTLLA